MLNQGKKNNKKKNKKKKIFPHTPFIKKKKKKKKQKKKEATGITRTHTRVHIRVRRPPCFLMGWTDAINNKKQALTPTPFPPLPPFPPWRLFGPRSKSDSSLISPWSKKNFCPSCPTGSNTNRGVAKSTRRKKVSNCFARKLSSSPKVMRKRHALSSSSRWQTTGQGFLR